MAKLLVTFAAEQCADSDDDSPRMPPSNFVAAEHLKEGDDRVICEIDEIDKARRLAAELKGGKRYRLTRRKYFFGALYDKLFPVSRVIDLSDPSEGSCDRVDIVVTLADGTESVVRIGTALDESEMLGAIVGLCHVLPAIGNARKQSGDQGEMHALGCRNIDSKGGVVVYVQTTKTKIAAAMTKASSAIGVYMKNQWRGIYDEIQNAEKAKPALEVMGGISGPGRSMMVSKNLANSTHLDIKDKSRSFGIWVERSPGQAKNWFFVMPDVSIDGSNGVVIRLFHGAVIIWDGRAIRHCSSTPEPGAVNDVYGCMLGAVA
jgi:hypothetical protein